MKKLGLGILVLTLCLIGPITWADEATSDFGIGLSYSDMDDFDTDWGVRLQWWVQDNWLLSGGWNNVDTMVTSEGGPMRVDGQLWQLDLSYILKSGQLYYGLGAGVRNIDADWTLATLTNDAQKLKAQGHAVVGLKLGSGFVDVRYEVGEDMFGYGADGIQGTVGMNFALPKVSFGKGMSSSAPPPSRSMYWEPADAPGSFQKGAVETDAVSCGPAPVGATDWNRYSWPMP